MQNKTSALVFLTERRCAPPQHEVQSKPKGIMDKLFRCSRCQKQWIHLKCITLLGQYPSHQIGFKRPADAKGKSSFVCVQNNSAVLLQW